MRTERSEDYIIDFADNFFAIPQSKTILISIALCWDISFRLHICFHRHFFVWEIALFPCILENTPFPSCARDETESHSSSLSPPLPPLPTVVGAQTEEEEEEERGTVNLVAILLLLLLRLLESALPGSAREERKGSHGEKSSLCPKGRRRICTGFFKIKEACKTLMFHLFGTTFNYYKSGHCRYAIFSAKQYFFPSRDLSKVQCNEKGFSLSPPPHLSPFFYLMLFSRQCVIQRGWKEKTLSRCERKSPRVKECYGFLLLHAMQT